MSQLSSNGVSTRPARHLQSDGRRSQKRLPTLNVSDETTSLLALSRRPSCTSDFLSKEELRSIVSDCMSAEEWTEIIRDIERRNVGTQPFSLHESYWPSLDEVRRLPHQRQETTTTGELSDATLRELQRRGDDFTPEEWMQIFARVQARSHEEYSIPDENSHHPSLMSVPSVQNARTNPQQVDEGSILTDGFSHWDGCDAEGITEASSCQEFVLVDDEVSLSKSYRHTDVMIGEDGSQSWAFLSRRGFDDDESASTTTITVPRSYLESLLTTKDSMTSNHSHVPTTHGSKPTICSRPDANQRAFAGRTDEIFEVGPVERKNQRGGKAIFRGKRKCGEKGRSRFRSWDAEGAVRVRERQRKLDRASCALRPDAMSSIRENGWNR